MIVDVSFKHMDPSDALRDYMKEKSEKLKKFFDGKVHLTWNFTKEHEEFIAHCHLVGNHMDYFGEARATEAYASVDQTIHRIEKQIQKHKEIITGHRSG